ncbi:MAG: hypothetical protein N2Z23_00545 [Pyrinomonadaceae bacterium]|nr:hypothetical protein [Pyrinomonadaceae bacterium]MCX7638922.1 hypothetical protein [Pyrinomonadaceae bacterium]MDW8304941.1 hypothetical protein [Acidobacteriota bacterium]
MRSKKLPFLTTLSLLSLILLGASSSHGSHYSGSDEKDFLEFFRLEFCKAIIEFIKEINQSGAANSSEEKTVIEIIEKFCVERAESSFSISERTEFFEALNRLAVRIYSKTRNFADYGGASCKDYSLKLVFDEEGLKINLQFSKADFSKAKSFVDWFNQALAAFTESDTLKKIAINTKAFSERDKILVVTYLPRACIEKIM